MKCATCKYWQKWDDRVYAKTSYGFAGTMVNGIVELRRCRYTPPPTIVKTIGEVYTDADFSCSEYKQATKDDEVRILVGK